MVAAHTPTRATGRRGHDGEVDEEGEGDGEEERAFLPRDILSGEINRLCSF